MVRGDKEDSVSERSADFQAPGKMQGTVRYAAAAAPIPFAYGGAMQSSLEESCSRARATV